MSFSFQISILGIRFLLAMYYLTAFEVNAAQQQKIPYLITKTPIEEHGTRWGLTIGLFLFFSILVLYYLRKKNPKIYESIVIQNKRKVKVLERIKLSPRSNLYLVEFDNKQLLIGQSGDSLVTLTELEKKPNQIEKVSSGE